MDYKNLWCNDPVGDALKKEVSALLSKANNEAKKVVSNGKNKCSDIESDRARLESLRQKIEK